jgi:hypothetical protein
MGEEKPPGQEAGDKTDSLSDSRQSPQTKILLPTMILDSLNSFMEKQDITGMKKVIDENLKSAEGSQQEILQILSALCDAAEVKNGRSTSSNLDHSENQESLPGASLNINTILNNLNIMHSTSKNSTGNIRKFSRKPTRNRKSDE